MSFPVCIPLLKRILLGGACVLGTMSSQAAMQLVVSDQQSSSHPAVKTLEFFGKQVAQRSKGEMTVMVKADGSAGSETETLRAVQEGRQAMARVALALLDKVPSVQLASLPYLFRSNDHMWKILKGDFGQRMDRELEQAGVVRLMYLDSSPRNFYCTRPIKSQADFSKLRVRLPSSQVFEELVRNLGGQPVSVPFNKIAEAFRAGSLDCADGGVVNFVSAEHYKVAPYLMQDEHLLMPDVLVMSKKVWDKLTPAQREILRTSAAESSSYMASLWREQENAAMAIIKKNGVTVVLKSQISMTGIESQAIRTYNKYVKSEADLETVMRITTTK